MARLYGSSLLILRGKPALFSIEAAPFEIPISSIRIPISPHPHFLKYILTTLTGVRWYLSVVLIYISAPHSSTLAWKIPWMEEPGRLQSMGSLGVGHNWATSLSLFTFMHWKRKWQPTPLFLPGESQGQGSLVGWRLWGCTESDMTEATWQQQ